MLARALLEKKIKAEGQQKQENKRTKRQRNSNHSSNDDKGFTQSYTIDVKIKE